MKENDILWLRGIFGHNEVPCTGNTANLATVQSSLVNIFVLWCWTVKQGAQRSSGVTIPGGVKKASSYGTSGHGLAGMVVMGWRLDLMILGVFSNLDDSKILWYALGINEN